MKGFDTAFARVVHHEGGYVWHPDDPGGETKWGISKRSYPDLDIRDLTKAQAKDIYRRDYWDKIVVPGLPFSITFQMFDAAVNQGVTTAIRLLQKTVGVKVDGILGPKTREAAVAAPERTLVLRFLSERLRHYTRTNGWSRFGTGWTRRMADNLEFALTDLA